MKLITIIFLAIIMVILIPNNGNAQDYKSFCETTFDSDDHDGLYKFCMYLIGEISKQSLSDSEWYSGYSHLFFKDGDGDEIYRDYEQSGYPAMFFDDLINEYSDDLTFAYESNQDTQPETSSFISGGFNTNSIEAANSGCPVTPWENGKRGYEDSSGGWVKVVVPIPADVMTSAFELRFAAGSDGSANEAGVYIDDVCIAVGDYNLCD